MEFEEDRQDNIRQIRLLDPDYLEQITEEFEQLMGQSIV